MADQVLAQISVQIPTIGTSLFGLCFSGGFPDLFARIQSTADHGIAQISVRRCSLASIASTDLVLGKIAVTAFAVRAHLHHYRGGFTTVFT